MWSVVSTTRPKETLLRSHLVRLLNQYGAVLRTQGRPTKMAQPPHTLVWELS